VLPRRPHQHFLDEDVDRAVGEILTAYLGRRAEPLRRRGAGIRIAILDTWPIAPGSDDMFSLLRPFRDLLKYSGANYALLDDFAEGRIIPRSRMRDYVEQSSLRWMCARGRKCNGDYEPEYRFADHGLFIADILNNIAPNAELALYRVLNDFGTLHFYSLAKAVEQALYDARDQQLVMNLSLGFGTELRRLTALLDNPQAPFKEAHQWAAECLSVAKEGRDKTARSSSTQEEQQALKDPAMKPLVHLFSLGSLGDRVLAVAAAGNEACLYEGVRVAPRIPAAVEGVLGVSAVGSNLEPASYSNDDDMVDPFDDGIGAFGGEVNHDSGLSDQGVVGLYLADNLRDANVQGFARWAGTSFATAVVSGLAACAWSDLVEQGVRPLAASLPGANRDRQPTLLSAIVGPRDKERIDLIQKTEETPASA
jgi:hypothetical protein